MEGPFQCFSGPFAYCSAPSPICVLPREPILFPRRADYALCILIHFTVVVFCQGIFVLRLDEPFADIYRIEFIPPDSPEQ